MPASRHRQPYEPARMDTIAWKIVEELQQDARNDQHGNHIGKRKEAKSSRHQPQCHK